MVIILYYNIRLTLECCNNIIKLIIILQYSVLVHPENMSGKIEIYLWCYLVGFREFIMFKHKINFIEIDYFYYFLMRLFKHYNHYIFFFLYEVVM